MPRYSLARMVEASKRFGLKVEVVPGAEARGSTAFNPGGKVGHHTAGARTGDRPSLKLCIDGRADLDGPLCNDFLSRAGVDVVVATGRANHAGLGSFRGLIGNSSVWGTEAEDDGDGTWTAAQLDAYPRLTAARLWLIGRDASWYCSHRTWGANPVGGGWPGRKIDPAGLSDEWMRVRVAALLKAGSASAPTKEDLDMALDAADKAWFTAELKRITLRTALAVQTGGPNTVVSPEEAKGLAATSTSQLVGLLMYGDAADDTKDPGTHPNNLQRIRAELAASAGREAALLVAVQQLATSVAAGGSGLGVSKAELQSMMDAAAVKAVDAIDLDVVRVPRPAIS